MNKKSTNIIQLITYGFLLIITGLTNTQLKKEPQLYMILTGVLTLIAAYINQDKLFKILFFIILGVILYINIFTITNWILFISNPNRGTVIVNGEERRYMDLSGLLGVFLGLILTPILLIFYNKTGNRNKSIEMLVSGAFTVIATITYIIYELR